MKWPIIAVVFIGFVAALAATVLMVALRASSARDGEGEADAGQVEILVATRDLPAIQVVAATDIEVRKVDKGEVPEGALGSAVQLVGQVLIVPVREGQVFTTKQVATTESGVHLAATLPPGYRAMSVLLSNETGIENVLYPGSVVDVVASFKLPSLDGGSSPEVVSVTLLQSVQVLGIGLRTIVSQQSEGVEAVNPSNKSGRMVMLMVDARQAEMLNLAAVHGKLSVSLRNPLDQEDAQLEGTRMSDLSRDLAERIRALTAMQDEALGLRPAPDDGSAEPTLARSGEEDLPAEAPAIAPRPEPLFWTTTILRGRSVEQQQFEMASAPAR